MTTLVVRVDGDSGKSSGMGHVYRSLAYVGLLLKRQPSLNICFLMRSFPEGIAKVQQEGYAVLTLPIEPTLGDFNHYLQKLKPRVLVIDTLGSSVEIIQAARQNPSTRIITLDDLNETAYEADIIINGILWATQWLPNRRGYARIYQGIEYLELRTQFTDANASYREIAPNIQRILISTGGADDRNFTPQLIDIVAGVPFEHEVMVNVIVGPAFKNKALMKECIEGKNGRPSFSVIENPHEMARFFLQADLALVTGGTVMFESVACGTPTIVLCSYEHQVPQATWLADKDVIENLGFFPNSIEGKKLEPAITAIDHNIDRRRHMCLKGKAIIDAKGIYRVVGIIEQILFEQTDK
jgi:spore coat polysaccharide biosynthesis predicted glycosyltransferase SpsG